ncbi:TPA: hypothetical protein MYO83_003988 [Klebsiella michiganensis]|nr:hypothetical protein [Klebsiella michiganensis]HCB1847472.1 hypothetical protein [Klebsiella oxytoca]
MRTVISAFLTMMVIGLTGSTAFASENIAVTSRTLIVYFSPPEEMAADVVDA